MNKYRATMAKCKTFDEWVSRFLKVEATDDHRNAWDALSEKPKRKRRTKAEMEAAREEAS